MNNENYKINNLKKYKIYEIKFIDENKKYNVYLNLPIEKSNKKLINKFKNRKVKIKYIYSTDQLKTAEEMAIDFKKII